jgi:hypothetical protein
MTWFQWLVRIITVLANILNCPECAKRIREHAQGHLEPEVKDGVAHRPGPGAQTGG